MTWYVGYLRDKCSATAWACNLRSPQLTWKTLEPWVQPLIGTKGEWRKSSMEHTTHNAPLYITFCCTSCRYVRRVHQKGHMINMFTNSWCSYVLSKALVLSILRVSNCKSEMRAPQHPLFFWKSRKVDQMRDCMTLELVRLQNNSPDMIIISLTYMACLSAARAKEDWLTLWKTRL